MEQETREKIRAAALRRNNCPKCGAGGVERIEGARLDQTTHWPEIKYDICFGCGWEQAVTPRKATR